MPAPLILCFAGSARRESFNKKLVKTCLPVITEMGATATFVDLADYEMPIYNGDLEAEQGVPKNALALRQIMLAHHGLLIAAPEYNSSTTPLLKNTIDWLSRDLQGDPPLSLLAFKNKTAGLLSASPGALGGLRGLFHVRDILLNIGVAVQPGMYSLSQAHTAFDESGALKDEKTATRVHAVARSLVNATNSLINSVPIRS
jgi:chromate reductase